jgi:ComF family protein
MFILERIIDVIAPHQCMVCEEEGKLICAWCLPEAAPPIPSRCYWCKEQTSESEVCVKCRRFSPLRHVWVRTEYKHVAKRLIYKLKFNHTPAATEPIVKLISESLPWFSNETIVVHIPTATSRRRQRGYDHAQLIAKGLSQDRALRHSSLLARAGQTRQVGSKRTTRLSQLKDAFRAQKPYMLKGAHILLVDDIVTTGSTIETAAKTLKAAGAKRIDAVVFAQKQ